MVELWLAPWYRAESFLHTLHTHHTHTLHTLHTLHNLLTALTHTIYTHHTPQFQKQYRRSCWACVWPTGIWPRPLSSWAEGPWQQYQQRKSGTACFPLSYHKRSDTRKEWVYMQAKASLFVGQGLFVRGPMALDRSITSERAEPHVSHCHKMICIL